MNDSSYSNKDGVASSTWPDPQWAMEGYPYYPDLSVPQSTHHSLISAPGYTSNAGWPESYIPDFNATHVSAFAPTFANLPTQVDFTHPVSVNVLERRHGLTLLSHRMFLILISCKPHVCSVLASATILCIHQIKLPPMQNRRSPSRNWLGTYLGHGPLPLPPTRWLQYLT